MFQNARGKLKFTHTHIHYYLLIRNETKHSKRT